jgi:hypothetical protein
MGVAMINVRLRRCNCGSKKFHRPLYDARAIFVAYVCDSCEQAVRRHYRPEIFNDPNYSIPDEEIWSDHVVRFH